MKTFDEVYKTLPDGWLTETEAKTLWVAALSCTGAILEVGCYKGRSTVLLAATERTVYCVDPWAGFDSDDPTGDKTFKAWLTNIQIRGYASNVFWFRQTVSEWLGKSYIDGPRPARFAYLDGDHTYEGTKLQIEAAKACGAVTIAVHDVNDRGDGLEVKRACLELLGPWKVRVERLAVWGSI